MGPVYDEAGLTRAFGFSAAEIRAMAQSNAVVRLVCEDGSAAYPANLFDPDGTPVLRLPDVIARLRTWMPREADEWVVIMWLNSRRQPWGDRSALEVLRTVSAERIIEQAGWREYGPL